MRTASVGRTSKLSISLVLLAILFELAGLSFGGQVSFKPGWNLFSPTQDLTVGRENAAQVDKQLPILKDAEVERYVNELGRRLSNYVPNNRSDYAWQFKVVNSSDINAFALPGGFIYVNRATIEAAQDEAQLAGVMAHEEGHVVMRHGTHQASQMMLAQAPLSLLGGMLSSSGSLMGQLAQMGVGLGVNSILLHNSRGMETQADKIGTYVLYQGGYDPHALPQFFQILEQKYPQQTLQFLSDHPNPGNRIKTVDEEIPQLGPAKPWKTDSPDFRAVKKRLQQMPAPPKPPAQQSGSGKGAGSGFRSEVMPSGHYRTLNHSAFSIDYPDNWQVFGDENSAVTIAPQAGISQNALTYGVMINTFQPEAGRDDSLDAATHELIDALHQSNPDSRVVGHDEDMRVDRVPAKSVDLIGPSPVHREGGGSQRERDWLVTLQRPDSSLLYLVFISPEDDSRQLRLTFEDMLRSFHLR